MEYQYGEVKRSTINELKALLGQESVSTKEHELEGFAHDEMPSPEKYLPRVIVRPADTEAVSKLFKYAFEHRIPVTPRGAGTGLSGGCVPLYGGIVLSLERMNRIIEIDSDNFIAVAEPGVPLAELSAAVEQHKLYFPVHIGEMSATLGGAVSTNAGGTNAVKYGVTRDHILGIQAVLPNGDIINTGGAYVKCSTGYDLTQLITGAEGTLAVITRIICKLTTSWQKREVLFVPFNDLQNAIDAVPDILRLKILPTGIEFLERTVIEIVEKYLETEIPYHEYEAFLMIFMEGDSEQDLLHYFSRVEKICTRHGALRAMVPGSERAKRKLLDAREKVYHALKKYAPMEVIDVVVPRKEVARFVKKVKEISASYGIPVAASGHAGDGNVHLHPLCHDMYREDWDKKLPALMKEIYQAGVSFGGTISGEHGIGFEKKIYIGLGVDTPTLNIMKSIKSAFDPHNILNPGKIFDL